MARSANALMEPPISEIKIPPPAAGQIVILEEVLLRVSHCRSIMFPLSFGLQHMKDNFGEAYESFSKQVDLETASVPVVLSALADFLLRHSDSMPVCSSFRPILLDLVSRSLARIVTVQDLEEAVKVMLPSVLRLGPSCLLNVVVEGLRELSPLSVFDRVNDLSLPELRALVRCTHELLSFSIRFAALWSWAPLLSLVRHADEEVRFFAASSSALYLRMSDAERRQFVPLNENSKLRLSLVNSGEKKVECSTFEWDMTLGNVLNCRLIVAPNDLFSSVVSVCGILLPRRKKQPGSEVASSSSSSSKLVYTNSAVRNLQAIALALARGRPVVVAGDTGAGKSCLIAEVARITGHTEMISIHLGDCSDAKSLLGTYVCTDVPGEFRWQPGSLTQAVVEGMWVLIEDIDLAPLDVMSVLLPLLESRKLFIPGRGEEVVAADGFQLLATQSLAGARKSNGVASSVFLSGLWTRVVIEPLSSPELCQVLSQLYPGLSPQAEMLVQARDALLQKPELQFHMRGSSARDVKKWFHRIFSLHPALASGLKKPLTTEGRRRVFGEALDCFSGMMSASPARALLVSDLGRCLGLPQDMVEQHVLHRKPEVLLAPDIVTVGRALPLMRKLRLDAAGAATGRLGLTSRSFVLTRHALRTLEKVAVSVSLNEPVLCVGETGVGKTASIQHLADLLGQDLVVVNLNQQSDSSDLLGSFRPLEMRVLCLPLKRQFDQLFARSFSQSANQQFLDQVEKSFVGCDWKRFLALLRQADKLYVSSQSATKKRKVSESVQTEWNEFSVSISRLETQQRRLKQSFAFAFVEGSLVNAVRNGQWILLDEINLASSDMLESISGLLEGESLLLAERGDTMPVPRHPNFRLFACMNPSTNAGRKDLPPGLRNRFSEYFVDECENADDLAEIVQSFIRGDAGSTNRIVQFYLNARTAATALRDGAGRSPKYSLRSMIRALEYARSTQAQYGLVRALYDGFCMTFLTQLNLESQAAMVSMIRGSFPPGQAAQVPPEPAGGNHVRVQHFWIEKGSLEPNPAPRYILTRTITKHLKNLARVVVTRRYPALLQGPTASGKTSMVEYLAKVTGHRFVRINNHEHTDISEYMGSYISDENGRLVFREGVLVEAVRNGYWIVLDELNLAPSDVLESLNRLLDDNRELFIPETQEVVKPHPHFALFATQNPPGLYGGRKLLSPAFSNRFLELHFDDLPDDELQEILQRRCDLAPSYSSKLVEVMRDLQRRRQTSQIFAGLFCLGSLFFV
jgi:midasin